MVGGEDSVMSRVSEDPSRGSSQATTVRLCSTAEVTPTGVGIRAASHLWNWRLLRPGGGGATKNFLAGPLSGPRRGSTRDRGHPPAGETE